MTLCLFALPAWADDFDMASYLQRLDRYYYCFSREGLKSFQAKATVALSGQLPKGMAGAWRDFDWQETHPQFDFSYVGSGIMPILSFSSNGGDPQATPERVRLLSNMANSLLEIWGGFVASPLFVPPSKKFSYRITRDGGAAFTIVQKTPKTTVTMDFDERSLGKKMVIQVLGETRELQLDFLPSPQGALPQHIGMQIRMPMDNIPVAMDLVIQYQPVEGYPLPASLTFYQRSPGQLFQATFTLADYEVQQAAALMPGGDNGDTQVVPASSENPGARHFFWKVSSPTATVYLLGAIHVRPHTPLQVPEIVERAFEASDYVGFEYDLSQQAEVQRDYPRYVRDHFSYPPGDSLPNHLTLGQWQAVQKAAAMEGVPVSEIQNLKPCIVNDYLARRGRLEGLKPLKQNGIDSIFLRKALKAGKPVFGMEFWYEPFQVLDSLPEPEQVYYLFGSSAASLNQVRFVDEIFADWKTGNTVDMASLMYSGLAPDDRAIMEKILVQRNQYWIPQMDRILASRGTYFIVVGSGHLVGSYGLPALLSQKGYPVKQL